jgi:carbamoyl-phosphate synthase small subunit
MSKALLVLEDGKVFTGHSYGTEGKSLGEVVFCTGMTGYQETLTDPSYAGQIVVQTAPHIGNTGVNARDEESSKVWVAGYVVRDASRIVSNFRSEDSLDNELVKYGVVGIRGIDTRALTRHLRDRGVMRGGVFSGSAAEQPIEALLIEVQSAKKMQGLSLSNEVSTSVRASGDS